MSVKGEKYKSMAAMKKHEKTEPMSARMKEYGPKKAMKKTAKKVAKKSARRGMFGSK
jgi:quinol monooxygenase YgiN